MTSLFWMKNTVASNIRQGGNFWYSFACCMGLNLSLNMAEKAFSPFHLLYLIFPNGDVNTITAIIIILKTGLIRLIWL